MEKKIPALRGVIIGVARKKTAVLHDIVQQVECGTAGLNDSGLKRISQRLTHQLED